MKHCCRLLSLWGAIATVSIGLPTSAGGLAAETLFPALRINGVTVSPSGDWALARAVNGEMHGLIAQKLGSKRATAVFGTEDAIHAVYWVGKDRFVVIFTEDSSVLVARIYEQEGEPRIERHMIRAPGGLADPLPLVDDFVLWQVRYPSKSSVQRIQLQDLIDYRGEMDGRVMHLGETLGTIRGSVSDWVVDRSGNPRAALRDDDGTLEILTRAVDVKSFRVVYSFEEDSGNEIYPKSVAPGGEALIVLAYGGHDTMGIHEFEPESGTLGARIFGRDDVDVTDVLFDPIHGDLIAAVYEDGGQRRYHYLDRDVEGICGDKSSDSRAVFSRSADRRIYSVKASSPTNPGTWYLCDASTRSAVVVAKVAEDLDASQLSDVQSIEVTSQDGTRVEAFLTVPSDLGGDAAPLVVIPHGGPFDARDSKVYDPFVQYFASWGFAVLQVNYRGSSGYGRTFKEAGRREWARGIEDDIDAAVELIVQRPEIDGDRICIVGGSYGGFSALASILRHPERYRCAVTINGVTDVPLLFESSDIAEDERNLRLLTERLADVETERPRLVEISPVYDVRRMQTPVYVIYGTKDRRVVPEHAHRLLLMLDLLGKEHEVLEIRGGEHSPDRREWIVITRSIRRYLTRYLFPSRTFVDDRNISPGP
ncbi:MAG: S9 family peptidase [Myxococcales bacterium]|nr:S9 family peptidase [Myxococcales bacterium]